MTGFRGISNRFAKFQSGLCRLLAQGYPSRRMAWGLALGITFGLAPLAWGTTLICLLLAFALRLPMAAVQAGNYAVYPLQITLFLPFLAAGQYLLASDRREVLESARQILAKDPLEFVRVFWQVNLRGLAVWLIVSPVLLWLAYRLAYRLLPERDGN